MWKVENFEKFIEARRQLILDGFKPYLQSAVSVGEEHVTEAMA